MIRTVLVFIATIVLTGLASAQVPLPESLTFDTNVVPNTSAAKPVRLSATLHLPASSGRVAAMVIVNSSGGVLPHREVYYARHLAQNGIAGLVIDSFGPRGVKSTVADQTLVTTWQLENDAFAALAILQKDPRIDSQRIGVMGVSKGGIASMNAAMAVRQAWRRTGDAAFALHVPIVPSCMEQHRSPKTTGAPMLVMLAELDDYTPAKPCLEHAERIRRGGHQNIRVIVYSGAHHGWESGSLAYLPTAMKSVCPALIEDDGAYTFSARGKTLRGPAINSFIVEAGCLTYGAHAGGGPEALKHQATADLIAFLKANGF